MNAPAIAPIEPVEPVTPVAGEEPFDYEAEFNAIVSKREGEGEAAPEPPPVEDATPEAGSDAVDTAPAPAAAPAAPAPVAPAAQTTDELLAAVPEAARAALSAKLAAADAATAEAARLANDNRSMAGRISAYQRRYEEAAGIRQPTPDTKPSPEQMQEWTKFQSDYPEIAKAIEVRFRAQAPEAPQGATQELVQYVQEKKREEFLRDAFAAVEAVHPRWREEGRTPEFNQWKASSPTYQKLAASDDVADAIALFDLYHAHQPKAATPSPSPTANHAATQLAARRAAQAEGARAPTGTSASPSTNVDANDEDQLWAFYAKQANGRIARRNS